MQVDNRVLTAERLGGADYDGDMVKTIASPIVNQCVRKNYFEYSKSFGNMDNTPLLMIPGIEPLIRDANDWRVRFETVKNTFSSRVGQISTAALNRSIIACNENSTAEERERYRQEVEALTILTGLEIDSAKSGVRPDLSKYVGAKDIKRSRFLRLNDIMDDAEKGWKWYEPTRAERLKAYHEKTDWSRVDSNLEKLPYLAYQLEKHTPKLKPRKNKPADLYTFAEPGWKTKRNPTVLWGGMAYVQTQAHGCGLYFYSGDLIWSIRFESSVAKPLPDPDHDPYDLGAGRVSRPLADPGTSVGHCGFPDQCAGGELGVYLSLLGL